MGGNGNNLFDYVALLKWRVASWRQPYVHTRLQLGVQSKFLKKQLDGACIYCKLCKVKLRSKEIYCGMAKRMFVNIFIKSK